MLVAKHQIGTRTLKGTLIMKRIFSLLFGAVLLLGGATLGLQANSASAAARPDRNNWRYSHHHHHRHHHNRYHRNRLSW